MKKYEKMLIAIKDADFNCFANKGDWLYIANNKDTKKGLFRLPNYIYYFVSINDERMPSEIGVVKKINGHITAKELAELDYKSRKKDISLLTDETVKEYEWFLEKVNAQPEHTPMAVTWFEKVLPKKEKELRVHKKFFTGLSKEEKKELFEI
ncbi:MULTISPECIES: hypothetical protein [Peribacillus]|uniref:hypothetical protein n=1 Tax=Peribacillus TaxID=2675229 RepID=UPI0021A3FB08|nr:MULTISPECIES: hypothetical protein [Peribacillus]UYY96955.1 hypothetical protein OJ967_15990 [Peribacillus frigoritolerans]WHY58613.1 hypothetical protein QNH43_10295 [Peribacillus simplex]